jgi:hypothetical protein
VIRTVVDFTGAQKKYLRKSLPKGGKKMPQPTQGQVVAESIPPQFDIELPPAPIFITEHAVAFSTAAAVSPQRTHWWTAATRAVGQALQRRFVAYPPRLDFLDSSRMDREMHRL